MDSDSDDEDFLESGGRLIESSILKTRCLSNDEFLEPHKRFWVEMRPKQRQKVSLKLYRTESKKIFRILQRFCDQVEKASCDEAFLDVTSRVWARQEQMKLDDYDANWDDALFMGFEKGQGRFTPQRDSERRMWLANKIAAEVRQAVFDELGYTSSAGIARNKAIAKTACSYNKPNGQTVVPERYIRKALSQVPIKNMRWLGGKLGQQLRDAGFETMGDIQPLDVQSDLMPIIGLEKAQWIKDLSIGICVEDVVVKQAPRSSGSVKTFRPVYKLEDILKQMHLVAIDLILKIKEHLKDFEVFPTSLHVY